MADRCCPGRGPGEHMRGFIIEVRSSSIVCGILGAAPRAPPRFNESQSNDRSTICVVVIV